MRSNLTRHANEAAGTAGLFIRLLFLCAWLLPAQTVLAQQVKKAQPAATLNVATWNLRLNLAQDGANAWPNRREMAKELIRYHEFDLFGTQEGLIDQLHDLAEMKEFAFVGAGRDDGVHGGEHSAIFYRKDRFKLLRSGDFWLSETPDKPSLGWDATCCKRIASWAKFRDLSGRKEFYFFSVHFDHQGVVARRESARLMVKKIREIAGDAPVVCTGDLNSTPETEQVRFMQTLLRDARAVSAAPPYGPHGTFNDFKLVPPEDLLIDYIFVSGTIRVLKYGVLTDSRFGRYPSDHFPVAARIAID